MKAFEYAAPRTEAEVLALLSEKSGAVEILAGGTDLVGLMKKMIVTPERVVNIMEVPSLKTIDELPEGGISLGAAVTLDVLLDHPYLDVYPAIKQAIRGINSMQLQCQGTLGGEICQRPQCWFYRSGMGLLHGDVESGTNRLHAILGNTGPAKFVSGSRIAPALIALGAKVRILGPTEEDETMMAVEDFFRIPKREGDRVIGLADNQLLTHVILPPIAGRTCAAYEVRHGEGPEYPLAAAAVAMRTDLSGVVREAKVVMGHVAPTPWVAEESARVLVGRRIDYSVAESAGIAAISAATPLSENEYKVQLAKVAVKRAVLLAAGMDIGGF